MKLADPTLFRLIHDFFMVHLPFQKKCSPHTIRAYRKSLTMFLESVKEARHISLGQVTLDMLDRNALVAFLDSLVKGNGNSVTTRNHRLHCIRAFFSYAANVDMSFASHHGSLQTIADAHGPKRQVVDFLGEAEMNAILDQPVARTPKGLRDKTILILMYDIAARVDELTGIRMKDLNLDGTPIVALHGKGDKTRVVPISEKALSHLKRYLSAFHAGQATSSDEYLFFTNGLGVKRRMTTDNVRRIVVKYSSLARRKNKCIPARVHPHMFRHSRAMRLYRNGMDVILVSQFLGHAHLETTMIYAYADAEMKRKAIALADSKRDPGIPADRSTVFRVSNEEELMRLHGLV